MTFLFVTTLGIVRWPSLVLCAWVLRRGWKTLSVALPVAFVVSVLLMDLAIENHGRASPDPDAGGGERITVVSHNVLFDGGDVDATVDALLEIDADLVFLQEVGARRAEVMHVRLGERYPHRAAALSEGRGHGLVTYAKAPLTPLDSWASGRGNVVGQCLRERVVICNVHLTSPSVALDRPGRFFPILLDNERYRRRQLAEIEATALATDGPTLLVGDVNTMAVEPLFRDLRRRWVDAFRHARPVDPGATYPHGSHGPPNKFMRPGTPFVRPDYVLVSPDVLPLAARTVAGGGSDHRPLVATLELPRRPSRRAPGSE